MKPTALILVSFVMATGTAWAQSPANPSREDESARQKAVPMLESTRKSLEQLLQNNGSPNFRNGAPTSAIRPVVNLPVLGNGGAYRGLFSSSETPLASLQVAPGSWWTITDNAAALGLTKEQQRKMDDIFQQHRLKLIDLNASLSKEEAILDPLIASERLDEPKILVQIDRIAQARAELEKANSRLLLAIRQSLTMEQWTKLQSNPRLIRR